jgi:predicted regulator of amino acid metabolism with ACT domain
MSDLTHAASDVVRRVIERDAVIRNGLARGLINIRALARYVQVETKNEMSLEAIISAVRRHPVRESAARYKEIGGLLQRLTMKNRIVDVAIINDSGIPVALGKFSGEIDFARGETFRIVAGVETVRVVIDERNLDKLREVIPQKSIKSITNHLAEIIASLSEASETTPGVLSTFATELAINDINIIEFMSCVPELIIVVKEKDALKSYESLERLFSEG